MLTTVKPITVSFNAKELQELGHEVHINNKVMLGLKRAGIPVVGGLWLRGIAHGRLEMFNEGANLVYRWTPGDDSEEEEL